jgi:3-oxoacyl-[acyl-carrier-protein] synthase-3
MNNSLRGAKISATASYLPEKVMTNADLERIVETSDEWIRERTGIKERRIVSEGESTSDLGAKAAKKLFQEYGISPESIDLIICATFSPDQLFPATACIIQNKIGCKNAGAYDIEGACSGFVSALSAASSYVKCGEFNRVLVIAAECNSRIMDWSDRNTCVIFGDGAAAILIEPCEVEHGILSSYLKADGGGGELLEMPAGGSKKPATEQTVKEGQHYLKMKGKELFKVAVRNMAEVVTELLKKQNKNIEDINWLIPHQANKRIMDAVAKRLKFPDEKVFSNIEKYGNTSAATIAICFDEMNHKGLFKKGDLIVTTAFGGGLTWGGNIIVWD